MLFKTVMWHLAQHVLIFTSFQIEFHTVFRWVLFLTFLQPCFHGFSCYFTNCFSCLAFFDCPLFRPSNLGLFGVLLKRARANKYFWTTEFAFILRNDVVSNFTMIFSSFVMIFCDKCSTISQKIALSQV